jgi:hypothetical protein
MIYKCSLCFFCNEYFFHQSSYNDHKFLLATLTLNQANENFWLSPKFSFGHYLENILVTTQKIPIIQSMMIQSPPLI